MLEYLIILVIYSYYKELANKKNQMAKLILPDKKLLPGPQ